MKSKLSTWGLQRSVSSGGDHFSALLRRDDEEEEEEDEEDEEEDEEGLWDALLLEERAVFCSAAFIPALNRLPGTVKLDLDFGLVK